MPRFLFFDRFLHILGRLIKRFESSDTELGMSSDILVLQMTLTLVSRYI